MHTSAVPDHSSSQASGILLIASAIRASYEVESRTQRWRRGRRCTCANVDGLVEEKLFIGYFVWLGVGVTKGGVERETFGRSSHGKKHNSAGRQ